MFGGEHVGVDDQDGPATGQLGEQHPGILVGRGEVQDHRVRLQPLGEARLGPGIGAEQDDREGDVQLLVV